MDHTQADTDSLAHKLAGAEGEVSGFDTKTDLALGLIDGYGGLHEAVEYLREEGSIPRRAPVELRIIPQKLRLLDLILVALGKPAGKRRAKLAAARAQRDALPLALSKAAARLPLSLVFLPQDRASLLMQAQIDFDD